MPVSPAGSAQEVHGGVRPGREAVEGREHAGRASATRTEAGIAGGLWLVVVFTGGFAFFALSTVMVGGDAAATAENLRSSELLFRLGFAANLVAGVFYLGVTVLLYGLLKPVSRSLSALAASFGLAGVAAGAATSLLQLAPLLLLGDGPSPSAFSADQAQALALTLLGLAGQGSGIGMVFFGLQCVLAGYLIVRSTFLPRVLGVLLGLGGWSYVVSSFASFLSPAFGAQLTPWIVPVALIGEGSLSLWLIVKGVNLSRWQEQARAAAAAVAVQW